MVAKVTTALVSSLVFCLSLAIVSYVPMIEHDPNSFYSSFFDLLVLFLIYAGPVYILGGIPSAILIEMLQRRIALTNRVGLYFFNVCAYLIAGVLVTFLLLLINSQGRLLTEAIRENLIFFVLGAIAAVLYYHVLMLLTFLYGRYRTAVKEK
ncbi:hypothetical protein EDM56_03890 [Brevibacillus fluminis]|uniref:DUF2975 domain-containing protein n=1 Tax=Brevibacillus fluminis TaxID=511487 RepID=A0A3M8DV06_9BACL|nr:hypothetical protein [Brevibacillus fluminis]RNB91902.1 hypothetical protein EDM56_03890 [Brevibacillus fluminis]